MNGRLGGLPRWWTVGLTLAVQLAAGHAQAEPPDWPPLTWPQEAIEVGPTDYAVTLSAAATAISLNLMPTPSWKWTSTSSLDDAARRVLRADTATGRFRASDVSDVLRSVTMAHPFLIDALLLTGFLRDESHTAVQLALLSAEALILNAAATASLKYLTRRERPDSQACDRTPLSTGEEPECATLQLSPYRSFVSGHSSFAAVAAGTSCVFHARLDLYDSRRLGRVTCATLTSFAFATATLRIVADRHHATDVLAGMALGFAIGAAVPALHLPRRERATELSLVPSAAGLGLRGRF